MQPLQKYIALFLLLLFVRAMVPDAVIVELHPHTHTVDKVNPDTKQSHVSAKHTHCAVEELFGAPYQGSHTSVAFRQLAQHTVQYAAQYKSSWHHTLTSSRFLRGPPATPRA